SPSVPCVTVTDPTRSEYVNCASNGAENPSAPPLLGPAAIKTALLVVVVIEPNVIGEPGPPVDPALDCGAPSTAPPESVTRKRDMPMTMFDPGSPMTGMV